MSGYRERHVQFRFVFGKDGCTGIEGWYIDNFALLSCPDCDLDQSADQSELVYATGSDVLVKIGLRTPQQYTLTAPPLAGGDGVLTFHAVTDLAAADEYLDIKLNGVQAGSIYKCNANDCPETPDVESLTVPAATWNTYASTGSVGMDLITSVTVGDENCDGESSIVVDVRYRTVETDTDDDGLPDVCDSVSACEADDNGDGMIDPLNSGYVQTRFGCPVGTDDAACDVADVNSDEVVDPLDVGFILARFGVYP